MLRVNEQYHGVVSRVRAAMAEHDELPNVKLSHFLDEPKTLERLIRKAKMNFVKEPLSSAYYKHVLSSREISHLGKDIVSFISSVLGRKVKIVHAEFAALGHRSYSMILDHGPAEKHTVECIIDMTEKWKPGCGGDIVFIPHGGEPVRIEAEYNACTLVLRDKNTASFYQYVNHHAKGKRQFLRLKIA